MRPAWTRALWLLAGAALTALLLAFTGVIPIRASSGHNPVTAWFLHTVMRRSVATYSAGVPEKPLTDPGLILKGAAHFETGCKPCHGAPGERQPLVVQQMTPHPPFLPDRAADWEDDDLFYVVKHGVKFTGMPAWPARERDDEIWAMVAFVRTLPGMTPEEYRRLAYGPAGAPADAGGDAALEAPAAGAQPVGPLQVAEACGRCHGLDGEGRGHGVFPRLAGQSPEYLFRALSAYAQGRRHSGVMQTAAAELDPATMRALARYYGRMPPAGGGREASEASTEAAGGEGASGKAGGHGPEPGSAADLLSEAAGGGGEEEVPEPPEGPPAAAVRDPIAYGETVARDGIPERKVPACADCHGPGTGPRNPAYPSLAGQHVDYLILQLHLFKHDLRGGSAYAHLMDEVAPRLTAEEIEAVARYYASLPPEAWPRAPIPGRASP